VRKLTAIWPTFRALDKHRDQQGPHILRFDLVAVFRAGVAQGRGVDVYQRVGLFEKGLRPHGRLGWFGVPRSPISVPVLSVGVTITVVKCLVSVLGIGFNRGGCSRTRSGLNRKGSISEVP